VSNDATVALLRQPLRAPLFIQVLALMLLSLVAAQVVNVGIVFLLPPPPPEYYTVNEIAAVFKAQGQPVHADNGRVLSARLQDAPARDEREWYAPREARLSENLAEEIGVPAADVRVSLFSRFRGLTHPAPQLSPAAPFAQHGYYGLSRTDHAHSDAYSPPVERYLVAPFEVDLRQQNNQWLALKVTEAGPLASWQQRILLWFAISALGLAPVALLFARRLAAPITAFAAAAERLGRDPKAPPVQIQGPAEVGIAAEAFNEMQGRLRRYVEDRTSMVAAIAHDLRTPLTRLRFRAESAPEPLRIKMAADIDQMDAMISATLAFVRGDQPAERTRLELVSLVESVADAMAETGLKVQADGEGPVVINGDPIGLRRLVANLLDNAVKFGGSAHARVYSSEGSAVVEVDDNGPGVPEADRELVFEPFHRGEPSRSRETGGAGLGLAVVRSIARAHGGDAALENRIGGGLRARATLPL
jgi:two-component system OmpR family sensor kinase